MSVLCQRSFVREEAPLSSLWIEWLQQGGPSCFSLAGLGISTIKGLKLGLGVEKVDQDIPNFPPLTGPINRTPGVKGPLVKAS